MLLSPPLHPALFPSDTTSVLTRPRVRNAQNQNICRPNLGQFIHHRGNRLLLHHRTDRDPAFGFERGDGRCALARCDAACGGEFGPGDVILAKDVFLGGCRSTYLVNNTQNRTRYGLTGAVSGNGKCRSGSGQTY